MAVEMFFSHLLFYLVITSAFFCFIISLVKTIKKKDGLLLLITLYYFFSVTISTSSLIIEEHNSSRILMTCLYLFYTYDIVLFLLVTGKRKNGSLRFYILILILVSTPILIATYNSNNFIKNYYHEIVYQLLIALLTTPTIISLYMKPEADFVKTEFEFWFISAFFLFSTVTSLTYIVDYSIGLLYSRNANSFLPEIQSTVLAMVWVVKYFLLLKAVLCRKT